MKKGILCLLENLVYFPLVQESLLIIISQMESHVKKGILCSLENLVYFPSVQSIYQ